ncbi:MAG TPA: phage portal protein [Streptosporangiaceae bacterium]|jgi:hypothetical protein
MLPDRDMDWPPRDQHAAQAAYCEYDAWYSGDPLKLAAVYGEAGPLPGLDVKYRAAQFQGGIVGRVARAFWGNPPSINDLRSPKLHVPLASDMAVTSADLLFSEPIGVNTEDDTTTARLAEIMTDGGVHAILSEAAELASAWGGAYLRAAYDKDVAPYPLAEAITPDTAIPVFQWGRLMSVIFWEVVHEDDKSGEVWRHLEEHTVERGIGMVRHGLYKGSRDRLGKPQPLGEHPTTAGYVGTDTRSGVDETGAMPTGTTGLAVTYWPNMRPNRDRKRRPLGRSDYDGQIPVLDGLDETWTSWMRDLRLGKGRIIVPHAYLRSLGPGKGGYFDADQEVYAALSMMPSTDGAPQITLNQFAIRVTEHAETARALRSEVIRGAGYSAASFGDDSDGPAMTATEAAARRSRSMTTRGKKIGYATSPIADFLGALLEIDANVFQSGAKPQRPTLEWPDAVAPDPEATGRTLQLIAAAEAASIQTRVEILHPDWDDSEVQEEVGRIRSEQAGPVTLNGLDPATYRPGVDDPPPNAPAEGGGQAPAAVDETATGAAAGG